MRLDDGNTVNEDACLNHCRLPRCSDGILSPGEGCDDGNEDPTDTCAIASLPVAVMELSNRVSVATMVTTKIKMTV